MQGKRAQKAADDVKVVVQPPVCIHLRFMVRSHDVPHVIFALVVNPAPENNAVHLFTLRQNNLGLVYYFHNGHS